MDLTEHMVGMLKKLGLDTTLSFWLDSEKVGLGVKATKHINGDIISFEKFILPMMVTFSEEDVVSKSIEELITAILAEEQSQAVSNL